MEETIQRIQQGHHFRFNEVVTDVAQQDRRFIARRDLVGRFTNNWKQFMFGWSEFTREADVTTRIHSDCGRDGFSG